MLTLFFALLGCTTTTSVSLPVCEVTLTAAEPVSGAAGDAIVLTGGPLTDTWDTAVYFGTTRALVTEVDRSTCGDCDACRQTNGCTACGDCDTCDVLCSSDCVETATVEIPAIEAGAVEVLMYNGYGVSERLAFTVEGAADTGDTSGGDTAGADTGGTDTADTSDTAQADTGSGADSGQ